MHVVRSCGLVVLLFTGIFSSSQAADSQVSVTGWLSDGRTSWAHNASVLNAIWGNPTSELIYENIDSKIVEVSVSLPLKNDRVHFSFGGGSIHHGLLIDDDYVSASGSTYYGATVSGAHRISRTHSDVTSSGLYYLSAEYHPEFLKFDMASAPLQLYAGLQYWKEDYIAQGVRQIECTDATASNGRTFCNATGFNGYNNQAVISNKVVWTTWYVGAQTQLDLTDSMSLHMTVNYSPFTHLSNEDTHHLRSDLRQAPSFSMHGFGQAIDLQLAWRYRYQDWLAFGLGYRYWDRKVTRGDWYAYSTDGVSTFTSIAPLGHMRTTRKGVTLELDLVF